MSESTGYKVLYSNDKDRWFGYGSDAVKSPTIFESIGEAKQAVERLKGTGLPRYLRIVIAENDEPVSEIADTLISSSFDSWVGD